ncbi:MAG: hypothetical protein U0931_00440 [Vulcanimicrobiota bacterium]
MQERLGGRRSRRATTLGELVVTLGILAIVLLVVTAMAVKSHQSGRSTRNRTEANTVAQNRLELQLSRAIDHLTIGAPLVETGRFQDNTAYRCTVEATAVSPTGPTAGLSQQELRAIRVTVSWDDSHGTHQVQAESYLAKVQR